MFRPINLDDIVQDMLIAKDFSLNGHDILQNTRISVVIRLSCMSANILEVFITVTSWSQCNPYDTADNTAPHHLLIVNMAID